MLRRAIVMGAALAGTPHPGLAQSTIAFVQVNSATPQGAAASVGVKFIAAQTAGDLNVVVVGWNDATAQVQSVVDSSGNTYQRAAGPTVVAGSATQSLYYAANIADAAANGNTVTVTFSPAAAFPDIRIAEYRGIATTNALDVAIGASGSGTSSSSGSITTTNANDLLVAGNLVQTMTGGPGTSFTSRVITSPDGDILEDRIVTTTGSYSASATVSPSGWWIMQMAAFRAAASGGDTQPPTAPGTPVPTVVSTTQINLTWSAASDNVGVTGYFVERCAGAGCSTFAPIASPTATSFNDTGLTASTSYSYRVRATDSAGNLGPYSAVASATTQAVTDTQSPSAPGTPVLTVISSGQINLTWAAAIDNVGVTGYFVERCGGSGCSAFAQVSAPTTTSFNDTGLAASTSYSYRVRATDAASNLGPYSATASAATATPAPSITLIQHASQDAGNTTASTLAFPSNTSAGNFVAVVIRAGQSGQTLSVTDTRGNTYRKAVQLNETTDSATLAIYYAENISGGATSIAVADSISGGTLRFAIFEYTGLALSNSLDGTATGEGTNATPTTGAVTLAAGDLVLGGLSAADQRTFTAGSGWALEESIPAAPNTKLAVEDQIKSTAGSLSATATLSSSDPWAAVVAGFRAAPAAGDTQPPTATGTPVLTVVSSTQINLTWTGATDNVAVTGYFVERCAGAGCSTFTQVASPGTTSFNDTGLVSSTSYSYRVRAADSAGNLGPYSVVASATTQSALDTQPPGAPGTPALTVVSNTQINLTWAAATDNVGVTGYFLERCAGAGCFTFAPIASPTTTSFNDTGLTASTSYRYRVRATDAANNLGPYSAIASATTQGAPDTQPPSAPGTPVLTVVSSGQINLTWTAATDNVGVTWYFVERCAGAGCSTFEPIASPATTSFNDTGLVSSTSYRYRVRATDAANNIGPYSSGATAVTFPGIALVQHSSKDAGTTTSSSLAFPADTTAGNWIAVVIRAGKTGQTFTVTDTRGNTYRKAVQLNETVDATTLAIYYAENINPGTTTVTVADSVNGGSLRFAILEYSGVALTSSLDGSATGEGSNATPATAPAAVSSAGELAIAGFSASNGRTFTAASGWTLWDRVPAAPNTKLAVESELISGPGSISATASMSSSDSWGAIVATFRVAAPPADLTLSKTHSGSFVQRQTGATYKLTISNIGGGASSGSVTVTDTLPAGLTATALSGTGWSCALSPIACSRNDSLASGASYPDITLTVNVSAGAPASVTNGATVAGGGDVNTANNTASDVTAITSTVDTEPPSAPGTLTGAAISGVQIDLSWGPATDNIGVAGYRVERCLGLSCTSFVKLATTTSTTFSDTGLTVNSGYTYTVRAVDAANNLGPYSNSVSVTTLANDPTLVAAYGFDEGSGTSIADASANHLSGTLSNAVWTIAGRYGNALSFNGTARVVVPDAAALHLTSAMTLEAWVNPSASPPGWVDVVYKGNDNYYLESGTSQNGAPGAGATAGSANVNAFGNASLPLTTWSHLAATYDGTTLRLYVNGTQAGSQPLTGALATSTNPLEIGGNSLFGQFFTGVIDEVRVYNVALTPTQIQADMGTPVSQSVPQISLIPANIDFGTQSTGTTSSLRQVTLTNTGTAPLVIASISLDGPNATEFAFNTTCGSSLAQGSACALSVTFTPTAPGSRSARIVISDNAPGAPQTVALIGAGAGFSISPRAIALTSALTQQFIATGGGPASLTWSVDGIQGGTAATGTVTTTGLYSPPPTSGVHVVTVTTSDQSNTSSATVYVTNYAGTFTHHNDLFRSGQNLNESVLTPSNVTATSFGKLFSYELDGVAIASPLYVANVTLSDATVHNVVYVATEHDSVYAFDADGRAAGPLWRTSFISPAAGPGVTAVPADETGECCDIAPEIGITGTPVIDPTTGTLYVVAKTKEVSGSTTTYVQRLHALDISTGAEKFGGPVTIEASVPGRGQGTDGVKVPFDALHENQRPALLLTNGVVYIAFGSHGDVQPYHGWVLGYNAATLQQTMAFNVSPNGDGGGIWQANGGPAADAAGNIYFVTGNGAFDATVGGDNYGDSFVKINASGNVIDYFTPHDQASISARNFDLGAAGPLLLPDQPGTHPHLIVSAGKNNTVYLVDRDRMGGYKSDNDDQIVQSLVDIFPYGAPEPGNYSGAVFFNGMVYFGPIADNIQAFTLSNGLLSTSATLRSSDIYAYPGATMAVSANGSANGILWAVQRNSDCGTQSSCATASAGILRAYDAGNLTFLLFASDQASGGRDTLDFAAKFSVPLVANGKVFVGTAGQLTAYGLLP
jgi:chitodextrinase